MKRLLLVLLLAAAPSLAHAQLVLSGNESKIDLATGAPRVVPGTVPVDTLTLLDFSKYPLSVQHISDVRNTVIGPPSNIAFVPDGTLALIASSLVVDPPDGDAYAPDNIVHVLDLEAAPPRVIAQVEVGRQPSGMSVTPDGRHAIVANRAAGSVSVLAIDGKRVTHAQEVVIAAAEDMVSDVAITPDGRRALVSNQEGGYLQVLELEGGRVRPTERKLSVYGRPYRCVVTPDGRFALTAGAGRGAYPDADALTVVDLGAEPIRTVDYVTLGSGPESLEVGPDGKLVAAVLMNGSNLAPDDSLRTENGLLLILARRGDTFVKTQQLPIGAIPEGVAFTGDGKHLIVQCHPARELWLFDVSGQTVRDTGKRIKVPGYPSSLRAHVK